MHSVVRQVIAGAGALAAAGTLAFTGIGSANAEPTEMHPKVTQCNDRFRTPLEVNRGNLPVYWSPFGRSNIVCLDIGFGPNDFYQRDPWGFWHDMNELRPGQFFYSIFGESYAPWHHGG
ncbi:hypothetical protein GOEFS_014_00420 [Gordonia effusa NBRC 100432]|uniref:Secreted protein n=1 Tax=Gordonia effusa NBRC 100432 TaxID=1077974 RepID=H0QVE9_9ACTN|nr:hypothetical protein GOEFS_014_00420 [Gordonia effusa NBRC 100432]